MKKLFTLLLIVCTIGLNSNATILPIQNVTFTSTSDEVLFMNELPGWLSGLLNGWHVSWERGYRECSDCSCIKRGMCWFKAGAGSVQNMKPSTVNELMKQRFSAETRYAGFDDSGNMFILVFNPSSEDFRGNVFYQDGDVSVPEELAKLAGKGTYVIKKGEYPIERESNWIAVRFVKR